MYVVYENGHSFRFGPIEAANFDIIMNRILFNETMHGKAVIVRRQKKDKKHDSK